MAGLPDLDALVAAYLLPFFRIAAMLMIAPLFGARLIPARIRLFLALALAAAIAPLIPAPPPFEGLSARAVFIIAQELIIGAAMGFVVQMVFDAIIIGSQTIAMGMGLGFAMLVDPQRGVNVPILSQFFVIMTTMMFLALNGHLILIQVLMQSFTTLPAGSAVFDREGLWTVASWGTQMFAGAVLVALPAVVALLVVNLAYGVISRAAPTLNLFAVGFPATVLLGFLILQFSFQTVLISLTDLLESAFDALAGLFGVLS
ncbi:MAG: flagellar biosynthetic protein FliR [Pseudomonadota bacterium]